MRLIKNDEASAELTLTLDELLTLHQSLNEVCNGIDLFEFQTRLGVTREEALLLMDALDQVMIKIQTYNKNDFSNLK